MTALEEEMAAATVEEKNDNDEEEVDDAEEDDGEAKTAAAAKKKKKKKSECFLFVVCEFICLAVGCLRQLSLNIHIISLCKEQISAQVMLCKIGYPINITNLTIINLSPFSHTMLISS